MTALLVAGGIGFAYPRSPQWVLRDFHLEVERGQMVAVHGPSGAGKSTLLYLLGLFLAPSAGSVVFDGLDTVRLGDRERSLLRAHDIGFVLQDAALHADRTIRENVAEGALYSGATMAAAGRHASDLLTRFGLGPIADRRPTEVSGGQAQRAALCRALIRHPQLILADEPTGNLDDANGRLIVASLREAAASGTAVVVVTHAQALIEAADRTVALT